MKNIIRIKEGEMIPEGATFLSANQEKEFDGQEVSYNHGFFFTDKITKTKYKLVTYFYYAIEENKNENKIL